MPLAALFIWSSFFKYFSTKVQSNIDYAISAISEIKNVTTNKFIKKLKSNPKTLNYLLDVFINTNVKTVDSEANIM